jgi:peroxiredoxin
MNIRLILLAALSLGCILASAEPQTHVLSSKEVPDFALLDYKGHYYRLRQSEAKVVALFFTGNGCPVARKCIPKLRALQETFQPKGVDFWLLNSNSGDDAESIAKEAWEFHVKPLPVLIDEAQGVAEALGVNRTGTIVCIETTGWTVFYSGAIDDELSEGAEKPATEKYLANVLTQFLDRRPIEKSKTDAHGCLISFGSKEPISYTKDVAPIIQNKCFNCHSPGNIGPHKFVNYAKVRGLSDMIQEVLLSRRMPPWHADARYGSFVNDSSLSLDQKRTVLRWIQQGAPKGEGEDPLPSATAPSHDWVLGTPDAVIALPKVQEIPATGVLEYRHIKVQVPFDHDVWLKAIVAKPDNLRVVHHLIVRNMKGPKADRDNRDDNFLLGWAPGTPEVLFPEGTGKLIKKGSFLEFEMHYTTDGREEKDQSRIGLYFASEPPKMVLKTRSALDPEFQINPDEANHVTSATYICKKETVLFGMSPHMHLRGSWFKYEALYPDGKKETLLSVPHYDFKWQHSYQLREPKHLPAGTWILCTGGFDNSKENSNNPNSKISVAWGDQSFNEMFIGFMTLAEVPETSAATKPVAAK